MFSDKTINELVRATFEMAKVKTGALMVIERETSLKEIERTGNRDQRPGDKSASD